MPAYNILPQLIPSRVQKVIDRLRARRWQGRYPVDVKGGAVNKTPLSYAEGVRQPMRLVKQGEYFGPSGLKDHRTDLNAWQQRWFRVNFPAAKPGEKGRRYFHWDCRGEHTVYYKGMPWSGLDVAHLWCLMPDEAGTFWIDTGTYQTSIWHPGKTPDRYGFRFEDAFICCKNQPYWDAYWDLETLMNLARKLLQDMGWKSGAPWDWKAPLDSCDPLLRKLLRRMDRACDVYERHGTVEALGRELKSIYRDFPAESWTLRLDLMGHSHLDLVWNWRRDEGERKGVHTAATMVRLLHEYPEFKYMWTQPALYASIRRREPALYAEIRRLIKAGRWEATGGMWVEADNTIPCGEALARTLALGQRFFRDLRGSYSSVVWLPDVFGYTACLPKLMASAGITGFLTSKLTWCNVTRFPYDSFVWRSPGGGEVTAHLSVGSDDLLHIDGGRRYRQADVHDAMCHGVGVGDGGGGTTVECIERLRRQDNLAHAARASWTPVETFFKGLHAVRGDLPVYEGELYLEYHRGVYTTQSEFKKQYRHTETAMQALEAVRTVTGMGKPDTAAWETICFAQFHDALPGSSIALVYEQMTPELRKIACQSLDKAAAELAASNPGNALCAFNPLAIPRKTTIEIPSGVLDRKTRDANLKAGVLQKSGRDSGTLLASCALPGLTAVSLSDTIREDDFIDVDGRVLDNGVARAGFDAKGKLTTLVIEGKNVLAAPCVFMLHPDDPANFDAWDIDQYTAQWGETAAENMPLTIEENGPVRACLRGSARVGAKSVFTVRYSLERGSPWLRVDIDIDWQESHRLLKFRMPTPFRGAYARFGGPLNSVLRPQAPGSHADEAKWETPASRWAAALDGAGTAGAAIVTEAKYGFSCREGVLGLTLLRSPKDQDPYADMGRHIIRFALGKHFISGFADGRDNTAAAAETLFAPIIIYTGKPVPAPCSVAHGGSLVPSWVLPSETGGGYILRMHEAMGSAGKAVIRFAKKPKTVTLVDILEKPLKPLKIKKDGICEIDYGEYDFISVLAR
ncbi:MAG: glycoside hydrolase family 38 C-terminal domain-containing protein [Kiritimatiellae bacterium]|nr:glycoside hydrolase family 38 C-terminal domain-containing protein [Kiritimatiellia bacterium]